MFYALGNKYNYFESRLNRFVALTPVVYIPGLNYSAYTYMNNALRDLGIYYVGGEGWNEKLSLICNNLDDWICAGVSWLN